MLFEGHETAVLGDFPCLKFSSQKKTEKLKFSVV